MAAGHWWQTPCNPFLAVRFLQYPSGSSTELPAAHMNYSSVTASSRNHFFWKTPSCCTADILLDGNQHLALTISYSPCSSYWLPLSSSVNVCVSITVCKPTKLGFSYSSWNKARLQNTTGYKAQTLYPPLNISAKTARNSPALLAVYQLRLSRP